MGERPALPDVDVLLALTNPAHQHHDRARAWLATTPRFATTPVTESGLVRLLLDRTVTGQDVTVDQAAGVLRGIRADVRATFLPDDTSLADAGIDLIGLTGRRQVTELHLVGLAAEHGHVLVTFDRRVAQALVGADREHVRAL